MALPLPNNPLNTPPESKKEEDSNSFALPSLPLINNTSANKSPAHPVQKEPLQTQILALHAESGWTIDPKTGVKHRILAASSPDAVKAFKAGGNKPLTLDQLRGIYEEDEYFNVDDLNSTAKDFLGHLQVGPTREEKEQMRLIREKRMKAQDAAYQRSLEEAEHSG